MSKKNKIIIKGIFIAFALLLFTNKIYADATSNDKLLIIDNISIWNYKDNTWYKKDTLVNNGYFLVYIDNKYYGMYKVKGIKDFILYDNDNNIVPYEGELFAHTNNFEIKNRSFKIETVSEDIINEINSISGVLLKESDLSINEYIKIDLDNNGIYDEIINVSNLDALDEQTKYFNLAFIKLNNSEKQIIINDEVQPKDLLNAPIYNVKYIFNNNDNKYDSIILEEGYFSNVDETKNLLLESNNGFYNKVIIEKEQNDSNQIIEDKEDYTLYIVLAIILVIFLLSYFIFKKIKNREDVMDD